MATIIIRDIPEQIVASLDARAKAEGFTREAWLRNKLTVLSYEVGPRTNYVIYFSREGVAGFAGALIQHDGSTQGSYLIGDHGRIPDDIFARYYKALALVEQNVPGDREAAIALLAEVSDNVYEAPYINRPLQSELLELRAEAVRRLPDPRYMGVGGVQDDHFDLLDAVNGLPRPIHNQEELDEWLPARQ